MGYCFAQLRSAVRREVLQTQLQGKQQQLETTQGELQTSHHQALQLTQDLASLQAHNQHLQEKLQTQKQETEALQEKLTAQFRNLANDLLEEKSKKFTDQNKTHLEHLLHPLGERLKEFEKQVSQANKDHLERSITLRTEVRKLNELNTRITKEAENLTKAIKGDSKVQGNWGEFVLEKVLERSGLTKDREYSVQESAVNEEGKRYQPDVVIRLPDNKHIVVDAKVSLVSYEKFFHAEGEDERTLLLKRHVESMQRHIRELSSKDYQTLYHLQGLDFVLMFVPVEPAFSLAIQHHPNLFQEAYDKNIVLVAPTTLMATLRTIANIWKHEYQNRHTLEIAQQGGALYDKFVGFVEDLKNIGKQIENTQRAYVDASKKLYDGKGNLVKRAENIKILGAKTSKTLPQKLIDYATDSHDK